MYFIWLSNRANTFNLFVSSQTTAKEWESYLISFVVVEACALTTKGVSRCVHTIFWSAK